MEALLLSSIMEIASSGLTGAWLRRGLWAGVQWNIWFGLTTMVIWQQLRNEVVFEGVTFSSEQAVHNVHAQAAWVRKTFDNVQVSAMLAETRSARMEMWWKKPAAGRLKLNCDATVSNLGAKVAGGGVLRNEHGNFIFSYASDFGEATIAMAELRTILTLILSLLCP